MELNRVAILGGSRIPFARSHSAYAEVSNQELMTTALQALVGKYQLTGQELGEVALGSVIKHAADWNFAREVTIGSGLSARTPAYDVQQACGTSLETAILVANKIALGQIEVGVAGGTDTNSDLPIAFSKDFSHLMLRSHKGRSSWERLKPWLSLRPRHLKPWLPGVVEPRTGLSMGESCELMAQTWGIPRAEQDQLALESHQKAAQAWQEGFYSNLVVPCRGLKSDSNVRADTTLEKLARLKPVFDRSGKGTLTAGNSSALTDGAACALLASEQWAKRNNIPVQAYLTYSQVSAVDFVKEEGLLMAPAYAVAKMLTRAGLRLQDFDLYEIHEAFAAQVLCTLRAWESEKFCRERLGLPGALGSIDRSKLNTKGGSVALGHPFAATGARIVASLAKMLAEGGGKRGLISICTGGGMGVTAILESA